ncbi:MAG: glutamate 5-kinase [Clostridiales bacterium]|nr:glutamate 5-kinase [Clostridiales bacterium]
MRPFLRRDFIKEKAVLSTIGGDRVAVNFAKRIVVKVGTSSLTYDNGKMNLGSIDRLCRSIADLMNRGKEVLLVSSGAIGVGIGYLGLKKRPESTREKQAIASVGQCELMNAYSRSFAEYSYRCGQILLTKDGITDKLTRANVTNTIETLLEMGIVPVINENDSVSTTEIMHNGTFGDNDTLSADVACLANADLLVILSDVDGLYDSNPRENPDAQRISFVEKVTPEMLDLTAGKGSWLGTGGMMTKLTAMQKVTENGICGVIADGSGSQTLERILDQDDVGTFFTAQ